MIKKTRTAVMAALLVALACLIGPGCMAVFNIGPDSSLYRHQQTATNIVEHIEQVSPFQLNPTAVGAQVHDNNVLSNNKASAGLKR